MVKNPDNGWQRRRDRWGPTGSAAGGPIPGPAPELKAYSSERDKRRAFRNAPQRISNITGRPYAAMRFTRCICGNSRLVDHDFCDRCEQLHELGYRMRAETRPSI